MDVSDYRQRVEAEVEAATQQVTSFRDLLQQSAAPGQLHPSLAPDADDDITAATQALQDRTGSVELRTAALQVIGFGLSDHPELADQVLGVLRDRTAPQPLRFAALSVLQQSSFQLVGLAANRSAYLEGLRSVIDDPDAVVRQRAIGILAREKDELVQQRLVDGLQDPSKALVPPAKAIQYLGYDMHGDYYPLLRQIVAHPPDATSRREAIRLLGADASSKDLLTGILVDKSEDRESRSMSALALQSVAPDEFEQHARNIVLDDDEDDHLRASFVTALTHFADTDALRKDTELSGRMEQVQNRSVSPELKSAAGTFVAKLREP